MHEEPLHLIPPELRPEFEREFGIYIEGDLCPACRVMVQEKYGGNVEEVPVQRIAFSEKGRIGIGTFTPSDPKSQDISELTGSIDLSTVGIYGSESDPRAYRFDGELNVANRGLMEFIEMLKCDEKFLYSLLSLSQEQNIKTGRFAMIYADEVIISHTKVCATKTSPVHRCPAYLILSEQFGAGADWSLRAGHLGNWSLELSISPMEFRLLSRSKIGHY